MMKKTKKNKLLFLGYTQEDYPYARRKQSKISEEKKKEEERKKLEDKIEYVNWAMRIMILRQQRLNINKFKIAAIHDGIYLYREVNGERVTHCNIFKECDFKTSYCQPMLKEVNVYIKYV